MVRGAGLRFGDGGTGGKGAEVSMASTERDPRGPTPGDEGGGGPHAGAGCGGETGHSSSE